MVKLNGSRLWLSGLLAVLFLVPVTGQAAESAHVGIDGLRASDMVPGRWWTYEKRANSILPNKDGKATESKDLVETKTITVLQHAPDGAMLLAMESQMTRMKDNANLKLGTRVESTVALARRKAGEETFTAKGWFDFDEFHPPTEGTTVTKSRLFSDPNIILPRPEMQLRVAQKPGMKEIVLYSSTPQAYVAETTQTVVIDDGAVIARQSGSRWRYAQNWDENNSIGIRKSDITEAKSTNTLVATGVLSPNELKAYLEEALFLDNDVNSSLNNTGFKRRSNLIKVRHSMQEYKKRFPKGHVNFNMSDIGGGFLTVVDADGKPVQAYVGVVSAEPVGKYGGISTQYDCMTNTEGEMLIDSLFKDVSGMMPKKRKLMIGAEGYPLTFASLKNWEDDATVTLTKKGKAIDFIIKDESGNPLAGTSVSLVAKGDLSFGSPSYHYFDIEPNVIRRIPFTYGVPTYLPEPGRVRFFVDEAETTFPLGVLVSRPGTVRNWLCPQTWTVAELGDQPAEVRVPGGATVKLTVEAGEKVPPTMRFQQQLYPTRFGWEDFKMAIFDSIGSKDNNTTLPVSREITDLPPGEYQVVMVSLGGGDQITTSAKIELKSGEVKNVHFVMEPPSAEGFKGNDTLVIQVSTSAGKPASGKEFALSGMSRYMRGYVTVTTGTLDASGQTIISGIKLTDENYGYGLSTGSKKGSQRDVQYLRFDYKKTSQTVALLLPPEPGDMAPDFEAVDIMTSRTVKLSDLRGKYVYIDFWATWCGPCQGPMTTNSMQANDYKNEWADKVVVLGLSIDDNMETVKKHIEKNGWTNLTQWWGGDKGWMCEAAKLYGIHGVPSVYIIGPDGKVLGSGNPHAGPKSELQNFGMK